MKTMKKTVVALLAVFIGSFIVNAQDLTKLPNEYKGYDAEKRAKELTDKMDEKLDLDDAQVDQIYEINLKYALQRDSIIKVGTDKAKTQEALKESWTNRQNEFKKVLNSTQAIQYEYIKEDVIAKAKQIDEENAATQKAAKEKAATEKSKTTKKKTTKKK